MIHTVVRATPTSGEAVVVNCWLTKLERFSARVSPKQKFEPSPSGYLPSRLRVHSIAESTVKKLMHTAIAEVRHRR